MARKGLNRDLVIEAARALVNRDGISALTMRALSRDLDVEAPSLYSHVRDKTDILDGIAELIYGEVQVPPSDDPWQVRIRQYSQTFRQVLLANPQLVPIMSVRPVVSASTLDLMEAALGELTTAGFTSRQSIFTLDTIVALVIGHVLTELSTDETISGHDPAAVAAARAALPADIYPRLAETLADGAVDRTAEFDHAMTMIIDGMQALLGRRAS